METGAGQRAPAPRAGEHSCGPSPLARGCGLGAGDRRSGRLPGPRRSPAPACHLFVSGPTHGVLPLCRGALSRRLASLHTPRPSPLLFSVSLYFGITRCTRLILNFL